MAMQIMSRDQFEQQLRSAGLTPTNKLSRTGRIWEDGNGAVVMVPNVQDGIPDSVLDRVLEQVNLLYRV